MALSVATNSGALMAQAAASSVNKDMEISMERLSTGKRINSAADDAAGVAIASRLSSEIRGTNQAIRNAMDGQALIDTAEGAHIEIENILQRMREIAVQAGNDTNDADDRNALSTEIAQLSSEIDRIAQVSSWAGQALLNGTGSGSGSASFTFQVGSGASAQNEISASITNMRTSTLSVAGDTTVDATSATAQITVSSNDTASTKLVVASGDSNVSIKIDGNLISLTSMATMGDITAGLKSGIDALTGITATVANNSEITFTKDASFDLSTNAKAQAFITTFDTAIKTVNTQRATLGAISNRLDNSVANLTNTAVNLESGKGRIEDADFAAETTNLAKTQILQQASTAMLAQANASKQNVLSLLQG
jgi:flagellin